MEIPIENQMDSSSTLTPRTTGIIWTFLFASALIRCWLMPLRSGFWLDETGTYYIISGNWHQFLERTVRGLWLGSKSLWAWRCWLFCAFLFCRITAPPPAARPLSASPHPPI